MGNGQLDVVVRHIHKLAGAPGEEALKDGQLLQRFADGREEAAFAALVRRHGPLVLGVCRRVLRDAHAAEDAFQATFLVLLRRARALDRRGSLAGWLHTVAYHVALRARARAARRQRQERQVAQMADTVSPPGEVWLDLQPVLDEELGRLPETYREAVLLCCVQGKSHAEAARLLGWPVGTVKGRLARARDLLRRRLGRRGVTLSAGGLALALAENASAAVPGPLLHATVETAVAAAAGLASSPAVSLAEGVLKTMFVTKLKIATALLALAGIVAVAAGAVADPAKAPQGKAVTPPQPPAVAKGVLFKPPAARGPARPKAEVQEGMLTGRVLGSDGKPLAGARVAVLGWLQGMMRPAWTSRGYGYMEMPRPLLFSQQGRMMRPAQNRSGVTPQLLGEAVTDRDGKFRVKGWRVGKVLLPQIIVAGAAGHGITWRAPTKADGIEIRLPAEQVIRGRLLDVQGQPAANVKVQVSRVGSRPVRQGGHGVFVVDEFSVDPPGVAVGDFDDDGEVVHLWFADSGRQVMNFMARGDVKVLAAFRDGNGSVAALVCTRPPARLPFWPQSVTTDARGRFTLRGVGRGQGVGLQVSDERYAIQALDVPADKAAKGTEIPLVLQSARALEGTVTDSVTGRPVPGATLRVRPPTASFVLGDIGHTNATDWRGRRGLGDRATTGLAFDFVAIGPSAGLNELPRIGVKADARGHFKLPLHHAGSYNVQLTGPAGGHYLPRAVTVNWPRGGVVRKELNLSLVRGVPVRGKVAEESGKAVAGARVDFWSKGLKLPEGVRLPPAAQTRKDGTFEALLPPAPWHLVVNAAKPDYVYRKIEAGKLVVTGTEPARAEFRKTDAGVFVPVRVDKEHDPSEFFYPDGWTALDVKAGDGPREASVTLRRARLFRGRVVGPDGKAVSGARLVFTPPPPAEGPGTSIVNRNAGACISCHGAAGRAAPAFPPGDAAVADLKGDTFAVHANDPGATYRFHVFAPAAGLGAVVTLQGKQAGGEPLTVKLQACGSARARFLDGKGKPLARYRPVVSLVLCPAARPHVKAVMTDRARALGGFGLGEADPAHYAAGPATDAEGRVTLPALIPGATYRISLGDGKARDFTVRAGQTVTLPDLVVNRPAAQKPPRPAAKKPAPPAPVK
jgi:RNA polymerase sigma factor (sigma-70 family)